MVSKEEQLERLKNLRFPYMKKYNLHYISKECIKKINNRFGESILEYWKFNLSNGTTTLVILLSCDERAKHWTSLTCFEEQINSLISDLPEIYNKIDKQNKQKNEKEVR